MLGGKLIYLELADSFWMWHNSQNRIFVWPVLYTYQFLCDQGVSVKHKVPNPLESINHHKEKHFISLSLHLKEVFALDCMTFVELFCSTFLQYMSYIAEILQFYFLYVDAFSFQPLWAMCTLTIIIRFKYFKVIRYR